MSTTRPVHPTRPTPPARSGFPDHLSRRFGYPPSRPASAEDRLAYTEQMVEWLSGELQDLQDAFAAGAIPGCPCGGCAAECVA